MSTIGETAKALLPDRPDREFKGDGSREAERSAFCAGAAMAMSNMPEPTGYGVARVIDGSPLLAITTLSMTLEAAKDLRDRYEAAEGADGPSFGFRVVSAAILPLETS